MSSGNTDALRRRVLLSGTMLVAAVAGYGRRAYAACVNTGGSTYQCSGANVTTQFIGGANSSVSTLPGFSINTPDPTGLNIGAVGDVSYTDLNASPVSASGTALYARVGGSTSLTIVTNGALTGGDRGIYASSYGGPLAITTTGNVTGGTGAGIVALKFTTGTSASVITGAGTTVSGNVGIEVRNDGTGATTITANGSVIGTGTNGIYTKNSATGTDLTVTTGSSSSVSGNSQGIVARSFGTGALTIAANGNVIGTGSNGINAYNSGASTTLSVTTGPGSSISGGNNGILAQNVGTGDLIVSVNGNASGTFYNGIYAINSGAALTVTTAAGTTVSGGSNGIAAYNTGTGPVTITVNGDVTASLRSGIYARSTGSPIAIAVGARGSVTGGYYAGGGLPAGFGIYTRGGAATVTVAGTVNGGAGGAISFDQTTGFANRLELVTGAVINGNVLGGSGTDTLGLSGSGSGSFNVGQLISFEAGQKTGSGAWTLTGTNTSIAAFSVAAGTLNVNGVLSNAAFTVSGGTLAGTGTVGNTLVSGGTFAPGSGTAGSSMTVNGTLGFNAAATYLVNLNPTTSSFATVSGAATLGGAMVNAIFANGSYIAKQYTILNAGSISGSFGTISNTNLPATFTDTLSYDATHAYLNLTLAFIAPPTSGLSGNQSSVGNALINFFNTNGGIPLVFGGLTANGLSQASGQPGASTAQSGITGVGQFANAVFDSAFDDNGQGGATGFAADNDAANAYAPKRKVSREAKDAYAAVTPRDRRAPSFEARWNMWASVYGGNSRVNGDTGAGTNTTTSRIFGTAVGATYRFTPDTQAGFALGGAGSSFDVAEGFGGGKADVFNAAVYVKHTWGSAYVAGLLGYSWQDTTTDRTVTISGTDRLHASFKAQALTARLEGGWRYATPWAGITPYAALQSTSFYLPSYGESATSGSMAFALSYASKTVTATRGELGAKFDKAMLVQGGVFTLKAKTTWAHDWNTERSATATFQTLPGATFTTNGAQPSANAALLSLGGEMGWHNGWTLAANFDGEFSRTTAGYAGKGSVRYAW